MKSYQYPILVIVFVLFLVGCGPSEQDIQDALVQTQTSIATNTNTPQPTATETSLPTSTPTYTKSPKPTNTPGPTKTRTKMPTYTPTPEPIILTGSGDSVVDLKNWDRAGIAEISYNGSGNFVVKNYNASGENLDLLVNTIGAYHGSVPINFFDDEKTTRFEVKASGEWEIKIISILDGRWEIIPSTFSGNGDDVIMLIGGTPDLIKVDATNASRNFVIWAYYESSTDLLVNEIAPYQGTSILGNDLVILEIKATGDWILEITAK